MGIDLTGGGFAPIGGPQKPPVITEEQEKFGPYGDPLDRQWPGSGQNWLSGNRSGIRPTDVPGWMNMNPTQRWNAIFNAYILVTMAITAGDMSGIEDDTLMILAWGANDEPAMAAGLEGLGQTDYDKIVGEGLSPVTGLPRINGIDSSFSERFNPFHGEERKGFIDNMVILLNDMSSGADNWEDYNFFEPGVVSLFEAAASGGNMTPEEQQWQHRGEMATDVVAGVAIGYLVGGAVLGPRLAASSLRTKAALQNVAIRNWWSNNASTVRTTRAVMFGGSLANYTFAAMLGYINDPWEEVYVPIMEAVEKGELGGEEATLIIQSMATSLTGDVPAEVLESEWWEPTITTEAPLATYDETVQVGLNIDEDDPDATVGVATNLFNIAKNAWDVASSPNFTPGDLDALYTAGFALDDIGSTTQSVEEELYDIQTPEREAIEREEARVARLRQRGDVIGGLAPETRVSPTVTELQPWHPGNFQRNDPVAEEIAQTYAPRYFDENYRNIVGSWSIDETEWFQNQAILAGLIDPESYIRYGSRDGYTTTAFMQILADANNNGNMWKDELESQVASYQQWKMDNPEVKEQYPAFITPAYPKPDYATLSQQVKGAISQSLGRRVTVSELQLLTDHLGQLDRQEWDTQVAVERSTHAARGREHDDRQDDGSSTGQSGGTVQQVDAQSRFNEFFEERYSGEIKHRQRTAQVQEKQGGLFESLNRIAGSI